MSPWERTRYWLLPLHDLQLLLGNEVSGAQMPGEEFGDKLSHLLWFFVYIKCGSTSSTLWPFHALCMFSGIFSSMRSSENNWICSIYSLFPCYITSIFLFVFLWIIRQFKELVVGFRYLLTISIISQAYTCSHYTCPICSKSLGDMAVRDYFSYPYARKVSVVSSMLCSN